MFRYIADILIHLQFCLGLIANDDSSLAALFLVPQNPPQNLSAWTLGDLTNELDLFDPLIPNLLLLDIGNYFPTHGRIRLDTRLQHHVRLRQFARVIILHPQNRNILDLFVPKQQILQLRRRNTNPLNLNKLLNAIRDMNHALLINIPLIPRMQPPLRIKGISGSLLIIQIPHDHLRAPRQHLARLPNLRLGPILLQNLHLCRRHNRAPLMRISVIELLGRMRRNAATTLRHAVPLLEPRLRELFLQRLDDFLAEGRGARAEARHVREVVFVDEGVAHHADEDRRDHEQLGQLVFDNGVEHAFHGELGEHDDFGVEEDGEVHLVD